MRARVADLPKFQGFKVSKFHSFKVQSPSVSHLLLHSFLGCHLERSKRPRRSPTIRLLTRGFPTAIVCNLPVLLLLGVNRCNLKDLSPRIPAHGLPQSFAPPILEFGPMPWADALGRCPGPMPWANALGQYTLDVQCGLPTWIASPESVATCFSARPWTPECLWPSSQALPRRSAWTPNSPRIAPNAAASPPLKSMSWSTAMPIGPPTLNPAGRRIRTIMGLQTGLQ